MKAARFYGGKDIRLETLPDPEPGEGEVLIAVKSTGICGGDLRAYRADASKKHEPRIEGHEIAGEVVALGAAVTSRKVGDRVAVEPIVPCLVCEYCLQGKYEICGDLKHMSGGFADLMTTKERNAHPITDDLSFDHGSMSEVYAVAVHALTRVPVAPGETVVVIGSGPIGLSIAEMAALAGAGVVIVLGMADTPLRTIREMIGALVVDVDKEDAEEAVLRYSDGKGVDVVFECVGGKAETLKQALAITAPGGRIGMVGGQSVAKELPIGRAQNREMSLHGIFCYGRRGLRSEFEIAIDLQSKGLLNAEPLITHRFALEEIHEAFEAGDKRLETGSIKVVVNP